MSTLIEITATTFETLVLASPHPVVLEVGAERCAPCRALERVMRELATEHGGAVRMASVDADAEPQLAARLGVRGLPTLIVFRDGEEVTRRVGFGGSGHALRALVRDLANR